MKRLAIQALNGIAGLVTMRPAYGEETVITWQATDTALICVSLACLLCLGLATVLLCEWLEKKGQLK